MRYLAIDLGERRTGLATGDDTTRVATPLRVVEAPVDDRLIETIVQAAEEYDATAYVVGLPLNMDGTEGPPAKAMRAFAERIAQRTGRPVHMQDERLTSVAAEGVLDRSGLTRGEKKRRRDALAAAVILDEFLAAQLRDQAAVDDSEPA